MTLNSITQTIMADDQNQDVQEAPVVSEESLVEAAPAESAEAAAEVLADAPEVQEEAPAEEKAEEATPAEEPKEEKKASKAVSKDLEKIIESIEKLSVLELADLVHALEDKFGVSASAPVAVAAASNAGGPAGEAAEEQTTFNVILSSAGANKIGVIKAVREILPTLGLKEAKDLVEAAPKPVIEGVNKETANEAKTKLTAAGATVELQ